MHLLIFKTKYMWSNFQYVFPGGGRGRAPASWVMACCTQNRGKSPEAGNSGCRAPGSPPGPEQRRISRGPIFLPQDGPDSGSQTPTATSSRGADTLGVAHVVPSALAASTSLCGPAGDGMVVRLLGWAPRTPSVCTPCPGHGPPAGPRGAAPSEILRLHRGPEPAGGHRVQRRHSVFFPAWHRPPCAPCSGGMCWSLSAAASPGTSGKRHVS